MQKYIVWYRLFLKAFLKNRIYQMQIVVMGILLFLFAGASFPQNDSVQIGVYAGAGKAAENITEELLTEEGVFSFCVYDSEKTLVGDVTTGKLECGFVFPDNFDQCMEQDELRNAVTYFSTPYTLNGEIAKETVYAKVLREYSDHILKQGNRDIYGNEEEERNQYLLGKNEDYLEGADLFQIQIRKMETKSSGQMSDKADLLHGISGVFVFLMIFLSYGKKYEPADKAVYRMQRGYDKYKMAFCSGVASGTAPGVLGLLFILGNDQSRGMAVETVMMIFLVVLSAIWVLIVGMFLKNELSHIAAVIMFMAGSLILCPVFLDLSRYIPAVRYVRVLLPLGVYLGVGY